MKPTIRRMLKSPRKKCVTVSVLKRNKYLIVYELIAITSAAEEWIEANQCQEGATGDQLECNETPQPNRRPASVECKTFRVNNQF